MTCAGNQVDPGGLGPDFIGGVKNVTVPEGRDVTLSCTVVRLGTHKVVTPTPAQQVSKSYASPSPGQCKNF